MIVDAVYLLIFQTHLAKSLLSLLVSTYCEKSICHKMCAGIL